MTIEPTQRIVFVVNVLDNYNYMAFTEGKNYRNIHLRCKRGEIGFTKNDNEHIARIMYTQKYTRATYKPMIK